MKIKASHESLCWEAEFEVTDLKRASEGCMESLSFFGDPITRADESEKEKVRAFVELWLPTLIEISMRQPNVNRIVEAMGRVEGCLPLDGSQGISLTKCDRLRFDGYEFEIETSEPSATLRP